MTDNNLTLVASAALLRTAPKASQLLACKQALVEIPPTAIKEAVSLLASLLLEMTNVTFDTDEGHGDTSMERQTNVCAHFFAERGKRPEPAVLAITRDVVSLMCPRPRMGESSSVGGLPATITVRSADSIEKEEKFVILAPAHNGRPRIRVIRNSQPPFQWLSPHHWVALRTKGATVSVAAAEWKDQYQAFLVAHAVTVPAAYGPKQRRYVEQIRYWLDRFSAPESAPDHDDIRLFLTQVELLLELALMGTRSDLGRTAAPSHGRTTSKFWQLVDAAWNGSMELDYLKFFTEARAQGGAGGGTSV
jgi:hypothetical protein